MRRPSALSSLTIRRISRPSSSTSASSPWIRSIMSRMAEGAAAGKCSSHPANASSSRPDVVGPQGNDQSELRQVTP